MPKEPLRDKTQEHEDDIPWEVGILNKVENKVDTALRKKLEQKLEELYLKQLKAKHQIEVYQGIVEYYDDRISKVLEEFAKSPLNILGSQVNSSID